MRIAAVDACARNSALWVKALQELKKIAIQRTAWRATRLRWQALGSTIARAAWIQLRLENVSTWKEKQECTPIFGHTL